MTTAYFLLSVPAPIVIVVVGGVVSSTFSGAAVSIGTTGDATRPLVSNPIGVGSSFVGSPTVKGLMFVVSVVSITLPRGVSDSNSTTLAFAFAFARIPPIALDALAAGENIANDANTNIGAPIASVSARARFTRCACRTPPICA